MKFVIVGTRNVLRIMDAAKALEARLSDPEIVGLGLIIGKPGLGKTKAVERYHAQVSRDMPIAKYIIRAMRHWTDAAMLKAILQELGVNPRQYRIDLLFDEIQEKLRSRPSMLIIDEIDAIAHSRKKLGMLKDLHDTTGCAILMVGEEGMERVLAREASFFNRINRSALVQLADYSAQDVRLVIEKRCEVPVDDDVCGEIYRTNKGGSMRSVIDIIRDMEAFSRTNGCESIRMREYHQIAKQRQAETENSPTEEYTGPTLEVAHGQ